MNIIINNIKLAYHIINLHKKNTLKSRIVCYARLICPSITYKIYVL